jgi:hypothetical protein
MLKSNCANAIVAVITAALVVTSTIFIATGAIPQADAQSQNLMLPVQTSAPTVPDRLPEIAQGVKGSACSSRGWPHYEPSCLFDLRTVDEARTVRLIVLR